MASNHDNTRKNTSCIDVACYWCTDDMHDERSDVDQQGKTHNKQGKTKHGSGTHASCGDTQGGHVHSSRPPTPVGYMLHSGYARGSTPATWSLRTGRHSDSRHRVLNLVTHAGLRQAKRERGGRGGATTTKSEHRKHKHAIPL